MFDIPSVPTESLYKFLALVGVISILLSTGFYVTQSRELRAESIKLNAKIGLFESNKKLYEIHEKDLRDEYKAIGKEVQETSADFNETKEKMKSNDSTFTFLIDGKKRTFAEYYITLRDRLLKQWGEAEIKRKELEKEEKDYLVEQYSLQEQKELLELNDDNLKTIKYVNAIFVIIGVACTIIGFSKWVQMQSISDELLRMELKKARKEFNGQENPAS